MIKVQVKNNCQYYSSRTKGIKKIHFSDNELLYFLQWELDFMIQRRKKKIHKHPYENTYILWFSHWIRWLTDFIKLQPIVLLDLQMSKECNMENIFSLILLGGSNVSNSLQRPEIKCSFASLKGLCNKTLYFTQIT